MTELERKPYEIERDGDGYLVWLAVGWRSAPGVHGFHALTLAEVELRLRDIEPCSCEQCQDLI